MTEHSSTGTAEVLPLIDERLADLRKANETFRGMSWDRSSDIRRNDREIRWLIDLRTLLLRPAKHKLDPATVEACAKFVEQHQETIKETSDGSERYLAPRKVGNLMGLAYVDGIRCLALPSPTPEGPLAALLLEYARDLRRNSSGGDDADYPWEWAKATADYLETLIKRAECAADQPLIPAQRPLYPTAESRPDDAAAGVCVAGFIDDAERPLNEQPQYIIEGIILRRLHEKRIEGYTIETAKEIAEALARVPAQRMPDPDLVQRCKELLEWSSTGLLNGGKGGSVRALASKLEATVGPHYALSLAETQTKDDAMRELVRTSAVTSTELSASEGKAS